MTIFCAFLLFALFASPSLADPFNCSGIHTINPPTNISDSWSYPSNWNNSVATEQYASDQNCTWIINVESGMYAYLSLTADTNQASVLTVTDSTGYVTTIESVRMDPYFLMSPSFRIDLQSRQNGTLGIIVSWEKYAQPTAPFSPQVNPNSSPQILFGTDFDNYTVIKSETKVSLLALISLFLPEYSTFLRAIQVFDGPTINSTHIGNLYQVVASNTNLVSSGQYLTLFTFISGLNRNSAIIIQDYSDVRNFSSYKAIQCLVPNLCQVSLDATNGTAAAIRYMPENAYFFVKEIAMAQTSILSAYTDFVTFAHRLADYTSETSKTNIPQIFRSQFTTFVLNHDTATVQFSSNSLDAKWGTAFDGHRGFFASPNYALNSTSQMFSDQIFASKASNITYIVHRAGIVGNSTFSVTVMLNQKAVINTVYSVTNFPGGAVSSIGDSIFVQYGSHDTYSTGGFATFAFDEYNSAATNGILLTIFTSIWFAFSS